MHAHAAIQSTTVLKHKSKQSPYPVPVRIPVLSRVSFLCYATPPQLPLMAYAMLYVVPWVANLLPPLTI